MSTRSGSSITKRVRRILLGDTLPTVDALDDEVVLHVPGGTGLSGQYQGADAVLGFCAHLDRLTAGTMRFVPTRELDEADSRVVFEGRMSGSIRHGQVDTGATHVFMLRAGRIREIWLLYEDQGRVDEFWTG